MSSFGSDARSWPVFVNDMITFGERALFYLEGIERETFFVNSLIYDATVRNVTLVGQAASYVPESIRGMAPNIPWRYIVSTRNHMMHRYFEIDEAIIWNILSEDIPALLPLLYALLESSEQDPTSFC